MFSQTQLDNMGLGKTKKISQDTFDEVVRGNIDDFDMEPDEAVASAIEEFNAMGVDLKGIIKTATGGDVSSHPASLAVKALNTAVGAAEAEGAVAALSSLQHQLDESDSSTKDTLLSVLFRAEAVWAVVRCLTSWKGQPVVLLPALRLLSPLLNASREHQGAFRKAQGMVALQGALEEHKDNLPLVCAGLRAAAASGVRSEEGKAAIMEGGLAALALQSLQQQAAPGGGGEPEEPPTEAGRDETVQACCSLIATVTNPDDDTQPSSRAFPNARALGKEGAAGTLVGVLAQHAHLAQASTAALCATLKAVAANNEICEEVAAAGGVTLVLSIISQGLDDPTLCRPALSLLRQLASSDPLKGAIVDGGGLELVAQVLAAHSTHYPVLEQGLGLLTNVTLRYPEAAVRAVSCGCADAVLACQRGLLSARAPQRTQHPQRQACMALRNMAARSPEIRPVLLERGAEGVLRQVKAGYAGADLALVRDAASAALRDLGLENYAG